MNCISCGNPNIDYEFVSPKLAFERNYLCTNIACYFEFLEVYKTLFEKDPANMLSSISDTMASLSASKQKKFMKKVFELQIFSEELFEKNVNVFFNNDKIIEFYLRHLDYFSGKNEKIVIGPITSCKILAKPENFQEYLKEMKKDPSEIRQILMVYRNKKNVLDGMMINQKKEAVCEKKPIDALIKNEAVLDKLNEALIAENLDFKGFSHLFSEEELMLNGKEISNRGFFWCLRTEDFLSSSVLNEAKSPISEATLMQRIIEIIQGL